MGGMAIKTGAQAVLGKLLETAKDLKPASTGSNSEPSSPTGIIGGLASGVEKLAGAVPSSVGSLRRSNSLADFRPDAGGSGSLKRSNSWSGESPSSSREIGDSSRGGGNFASNMANGAMAVGGKAAGLFGSSSPFGQLMSTGKDYLQGKADSAQLTTEADIANAKTKAGAAANQSEEQTSAVASIGNKGAANTAKAASGG
ncbi:hypothetical protein SAMN05192543_101508 [Paraburkholderia megapolitana]|uniref:Uncharacterized protein n=2 Tax=Paraburkholderia megapolitana TaxID=420953 RepID=A0A1I3DT36_9BURK|nr:hypothetical protein SAMN05192543_101508 [Paraburkholderia megapolitana]